MPPPAANVVADINHSYFRQCTSPHTQLGQQTAVVTRGGKTTRDKSRAVNQITHRMKHTSETETVKFEFQVEVRWTSSRASRTATERIAASIAALLA